MKTPFSRSARLLLLLGILTRCLLIPAAPPPRMPMPIVEADTANHRWLQKPVLESRLLDDMEQTKYTALSGDMVGSLPVGIQTRKNADLPYWPAANCYNYKEVWVHPSSRWLAIMADLLGDKPEGTRRRSEVQLSGLALEPQAGGRATFRVEIAGKGRHQLALRASNLAIETEPVQSVSNRNTPQATATRRVRVLNPNEPVVALVIPDGDPGRSRDYVSRQPVGSGGRPVP